MALSEIKVGDDAKTVYGKGKVVKVNAESVIVEVEGNQHKLSRKQHGVMNDSEPGDDAHTLLDAETSSSTYNELTEYEKREVASRGFSRNRGTTYDVKRKYDQDKGELSMTGHKPGRSDSAQLDAILDSADQLYAKADAATHREAYDREQALQYQANAKRAKAEVEAMPGYAQMSGGEQTKHYRALEEKYDGQRRRAFASGRKEAMARADSEKEEDCAEMDATPRTFTRAHLAAAKAELARAEEAVKSAPYGGQNAARRKERDEAAAWLKKIESSSITDADSDLEVRECGNGKYAVWSKKKDGWVSGETSSRGNASMYITEMSKRGRSDAEATYNVNMRGQSPEGASYNHKSVKVTASSPEDAKRKAREQFPKENTFSGAEVSRSDAEEMDADTPDMAALRKQMEEGSWRDDASFSLPPNWEGQSAAWHKGKIDNLKSEKASLERYKKREMSVGGRAEASAGSTYDADIKKIEQLIQYCEQKSRNDAEEGVGEVGSEFRKEEPEDTFLQPGERKYPVKKDGVYSKELLISAASEARAHGHEDIANKADHIRSMKFGGGEAKSDADGIDEGYILRSARKQGATGTMLSTAWLKQQGVREQSGLWRKALEESKKAMTP